MTTDRVTEEDVELAKLMVEVADRKGRKIDDAYRRLAELDVDDIARQVVEAEKHDPPRPPQPQFETPPEWPTGLREFLARDLVDAAASHKLRFIARVSHPETGWEKALIDLDGEVGTVTLPPLSPSQRLLSERMTDVVRRLMQMPLSSPDAESEAYRYLALRLVESLSRPEAQVEERTETVPRGKTC